MDLRLQVGLNVRSVRTKKGWSQEEFAFRSDLDRTYVSGIERGVRNPTVLILGRVAQTLGVAPADLFKPITDEIKQQVRRGRR